MCVSDEKSDSAASMVWALVVCAPEANPEERIGSCDEQDASVPGTPSTVAVGVELCVSPREIEELFAWLASRIDPRQGVIPENQTMPQPSLISHEAGDE